MFGFLSPTQPPRAWRQSYARVCQYQRKLFGITSLPFLSYEAAFLYQLATDLKVTDRLPEESATCCHLRRLRSDNHSDRSLGEFVAMFGMVLAGVKLQDDLLDSNRWFNHLLWWKYRRQVGRARSLMEKQCSGLLSQISACIERHTKLEKQFPSPSLDEVLIPTGDGFAATFRAAARYISASSPTASEIDHEETFNAIGRHVGQAIIAWDCAVDFEYDRLQKQFTPLTSLSDVQSAFEACQLELIRAAWLCPEGSVCQDVLQSVLQRVRARQSGPAPVCNPTLLERWGLLRQRGSAYARCDGCEALCCVAEAANCCVTVSGPGPCTSGAEAECCSGVPGRGSEHAGQPQSGLPKPAAKKSHGDSSSNPSHQNPSYEQFVGGEAVTQGALTPVGFVIIDGHRIPARAKSGDYVQQNTNVRILSADRFGVTIERS